MTKNKETKNNRQPATYKLCPSSRIIAALDCDAVRDAGERLTAVKEKKKRLTRELVQIKKKKDDLEAELTKIKSAFGEENSIDDLERIEVIHAKIAGAEEAINLLELRFQGSNPSSLSREIEDAESALRNEIGLSINHVAECFQLEVDKLASKFLTEMEKYAHAVDKVQQTQEIIPKSFLRYTYLRNVIPSIKDLKKFEKHSRHHFTQLR